MKEKIRFFARSIGIEKCGFTHYEGKTAIVCLFPYFNGYNGGNLSLYAQSRDYHLVIKEKLEKLREYILPFSQSPDIPIFADIGPSVDRLLAYRAGLGFYGKNNMLINPDFGSFFFIGYILCDIALESDSSLNKECDGCGRCIKACPGGALGDNFCIEKCASHISQKKGALSKEEEKILAASNLIFGCDICQKVCPHNNITPKPMKEFTEDLIYSLSLSDIENLSNREFLKKYKDRAFSWRGRQILIRNLHFFESIKAE